MMALTLTGALGHRGAQVGQEHLRDREGHEDRIDLVDGGEHAVAVLSPMRSAVPALLGIEPMRPDTGARISV